jgi:hypothetical protein
MSPGSRAAFLKGDLGVGIASDVITWQLRSALLEAFSSAAETA